MGVIDNTTARIEVIEQVKNIRNEENKMKTFKINTKGFIIPNGIGHARQYTFKSIENLRPICDDNNISIDNETMFFQLWQHNEEELGSENLRCHGFNINNGDERIHINSGEVPELVPYELFKNVKEGEFVQFKKSIELNGEKVMLEINCQCIQTGYRYSNGGRTFDSILNDMYQDRIITDKGGK